MNMYNLAERSRCANTIASEMVGQCDDADWNARYVAALDTIGYELVPIHDGTQLGEDSPLWAPSPAEGGTPYPYPSVIAPKGWRHEIDETADNGVSAIGEDVTSPDWGEGGRVHNWRNHVPEHIRAVWGTFTDEQRRALVGWAEQLADAEEWD